ncbi:cell wall-binding protein [Lacrimispora amygdalina]|uniref:cell wall-binding protein n=1 Tax=Lacrimispora amygdalina TaxID=253257 RepID=UPI000BE2AD16|nr:cell wall-binding protein [Lacrimispora amygdalina]
MRKQTKLVAVLSTAALLALGASMSSFAATGWQEENGTWVYYDKSGDLETEKWEKSGDNWFYLNEDGEMATDVVVEYNDNYYYVDDNGSMVTNKWVSIENEDYDGDNEDEPANYWYYFGSNGKAYKSSTNSSSASFKTVNGKKYIFDDEGKMLYGWVNKDGERVTGDAAWKTEEGGLYYLGDENDGAQSIGWRLLDIVDEDYEESGSKAGYSSNNIFDDENQSRWFYFQNNGKKISDKDGKGINGKKYSFDYDGRMNAEWVIFDASPSTSTQGNATYSSSFKYFNSVEDGARVTKGWFKVVPDENLQKDKYDDDSSYWYYADGDGDIVTSEIKTINGKKYLFDNYGRMKDGLLVVETDGKKVETILDDDGALPYDTEDHFKESINGIIAGKYRVYYFGDGNDGAMKTSKQTVDIDGDSCDFLFNKSGSYKGAGKTGEDNNKYYGAGMLLKADKDDKYAVVKIDKRKENTEYTLLTTDQFLADAENEGIRSVDSTKLVKDYTEYYNIAPLADVEYKLVNTTGSVQKNKNKAKDGNDTCYSVKNEVIKTVFVEN